METTLKNVNLQERQTLAIIIGNVIRREGQTLVNNLGNVLYEENQAHNQEIKTIGRVRKFINL